MGFNNLYEVVVYIHSCNLISLYNNNKKKKNKDRDIKSVLSHLPAFSLNFPGSTSLESNKTSLYGFCTAGFNFLYRLYLLKFSKSLRHTSVKHIEKENH